MAKLSIGIGSTLRSEYIYILDITSTSGAGKTGIAYNTSGLSGHYVRSAGSATSISFVTQTAIGAWVSGGFAEVSSTLMPGIYRVDIPDIVFSSGSDKAIVMIRGASNTVPVTLEYQLTALNLNTFTESSIASSTWSNSQRTITGGTADTVTTLSNRSGFAITGGIITTNNDKNGYTIIAGIVTSVMNPVDITTNSMSSIASSTWSNSQRTITGGTGVSITQIFPDNFEFMLITNTGRIYLNKADIEKIRA
jgi:hypothetical protein